MEKYSKIPTVWERDPETRFKTLVEGAWAAPELEFLRKARWVWTEKIDGTNIRVKLKDGKVVFGGKSESASIPAFLVERLQDLFREDRFLAAFGSLDIPVCLYGEGYGNKIQKVGKLYLPDSVDFILFDVKIGDLWLRRADVEDIADKMGIKVVPIHEIGTLEDAIECVREGMYGAESALSLALAPEGLVCRPEVELLDRQGKRIITKIKIRDFPEAMAKASRGRSPEAVPGHKDRG